MILTNLFLVFVGKFKDQPIDPPDSKPSWQTLSSSPYSGSQSSVNSGKIQQSASQIYGSRVEAANKGEGDAVLRMNKSSAHFYLPGKHHKTFHKRAEQFSQA